MLLDALPDEIRARTRVLAEGEPRGRRPLVVYWMRVAVRDHENPALDAAVLAANDLDAAVLVYHAVSERYPFASDRHHTFILEGARDVARGLARRGIAYALHVERPGARGPVLRALAEAAALVVTDEAPMPPLSTWTRRLAAHLAERGVPFWSVDASCIVPMPLVGVRPERAFAFRAATKSIARATLARPWQDAEPRRAASVPSLPFAPIDAARLDDDAIAELVAACAIDHGVAPVRTLRGGTEAGYARWDAFRASGLARYAARRNDAALDGTSRLSHYLHYGHVAPLRIAREAVAASADKFLDELLVWRELAWHFAAHTPDVESLAVIPEWARATLEAHARDPRSSPTREALERGRTGDVLWDLAQRALVSTGELHNNVRMTWGKAIVGWADGAEAARRTLVDLNHRYALDGRDPASYGGLYWCLGLFDRPFSPAIPVLGTVRPRPTAVHARRLDLDAFAARTRSAAARGRVAVVGGGVAGLACARTLSDQGATVVVFDKGRAPGGRLASRRVGEVTFDLGAQYFTARDPRFRRWVDAWLEAGVCARWEGRIQSTDSRGVFKSTEPEARFVAVPGMSALANHLASDLEVRASHRVDAIERSGRTIRLRGTVGASGATLGPRDPADTAPLTELGVFDALVVCLPPSQAVALVGAESPRLASTLRAVELEPCVALGFAAGDALRDVPFDGLFVGRDDDAARIIAWAARDASKPGRASADAWMLHAAPEWSRAHLRDAPESLEAGLLEAFARVLGREAIRADVTTLQRWSYARARTPLATEALYDADARIGVGGDWTAGGRVEGAFLSGVAVAARTLARLRSADADAVAGAIG